MRAARAGPISVVPRFGQEGTPDDGTVSLFGNTTLFTGREWDAETGLLYYRARYYSPELGRFLARDPLAADINLYRYVFNNPITGTDPSGLASPYCSADPGYMGIGSMGNQIKQWERERHDKEFASNLAKLKQQLSGCCSSQSDPCKKAQCEKAADAIIAGLQKAYQNIYDRGGPSCFSFNGPVCTQCEEQVGNNVRGGDYFGYDTITHIGPTIPWTDMSVPGTDHAWGEITCKATGKVFTIDFWKGGTDFWRCGPDAFGWKRTSCPPRAR